MVPIDQEAFRRSQINPEKTGVAHLVSVPPRCLEANAVRSAVVLLFMAVESTTPVFRMLHCKAAGMLVPSGS